MHFKSAAQANPGSLSLAQGMSGFWNCSKVDLRRFCGELFVPIPSIQIATDPLPASPRDTIMRSNVCASDTNRLLIYYRLDTDGRFLVGGRGATFRFGLNRLFGRLRARAIKVFPDLAGAAWPLRWGGPLALATRMGAAIADYATDGDEGALPIPLRNRTAAPTERRQRAAGESRRFWIRGSGPVDPTVLTASSSALLANL